MASWRAGCKCQYSQQYEAQGDLSEQEREASKHCKNATQEDNHSSTVVTGVFIHVVYIVK